MHGQSMQQDGTVGHKYGTTTTVLLLWTTTVAKDECVECRTIPCTRMQILIPCSPQVFAPDVRGDPAS